MGKKRIVTKSGDQSKKIEATKHSSRASVRRVPVGIIYIRSTYNNTRLTLTDPDGGVLAWSTSGALGFSGAKKGTPYAAAKVADSISGKAQDAGVKKVSIIISGVGAGRESSIRTIAASGIHIENIQDATPIPHNGPRAPKPRRV